MNSCLLAWRGNLSEKGVPVKDRINIETISFFLASIPIKKIERFKMNPFTVTTRQAHDVEMTSH